MADYKAERQTLLQIFKGKQQNRTLETQNRTFEQQNRTFKKKNSILKCLTLSVKKIIQHIQVLFERFGYDISHERKG